MITIIKRDTIDEALHLLSGGSMTKVKAFSGDAQDCSRNINRFFEDDSYSKEILSIHTEHCASSSYPILVIITYTVREE